jgi:hypothetical protein
MKTAVEWLEERYKANGSDLTKSDINFAKEMEKQRIILENAKRIGLMEIELNHTKRLLASCEKALEDRDNKSEVIY